MSRCLLPSMLLALLAAADEASPPWPAPARLPELRQRVDAAAVETALAAVGEPRLDGPSAGAFGLSITGLVPQGGLDRAGVACGDRILAIDGHAVLGIADLVAGKAPRRLRVLGRDRTLREVELGPGDPGVVCGREFPFWPLYLRTRPDLPPQPWDRIMAAAVAHFAEPALAETLLRRAADAGCSSPLLPLIAALIAQGECRWDDCRAFAAAAWARLPAVDRACAGAVLEALAAATGDPALALAVRRHPDLAAGQGPVAQSERVLAACRAPTFMPPPDSLEALIAALPEAAAGVAGRQVKSSNVSSPNELSIITAENFLKIGIDQPAAEIELSCLVHFPPRGADAFQSYCRIGVQEVSQGNRMRYRVRLDRDGMVASDRLAMPDHSYRLHVDTARPLAMRLAIVGGWCEVRVDGRRVLRTPVLEDPARRRYFAFLAFSGNLRVSSALWRTISGRDAP